MATSTNVSAAKPAAAGAVYVGATSATLPTSTTDTLTGFTALGYISEDGMTNGMELSADPVKAWGGDSVITLDKGTTETFKFKLIESLNVDVLKEIYGSSNVTGTLSTGISVSAKNGVIEDRAWVFDMVMRNSVAKRIVVPLGRISSLGEVVYKDTDVTGYEVTITASPNASGVAKYEYIKSAS